MVSAVLMGIVPRSAFRGSIFAAATAVVFAYPASAGAQQAPLGPVHAPAPMAQQPTAQLPAPQMPATPAQGPQMPPPADGAPPPKPDGFFDAFGRWLDKSAADFKASVDESNAKWRELGEKNEKAVKDAAAAQKEAAEALKKLSNTRIVVGRKVCEVAPNGAPDCQAAAEEVCRAKGYATGKSADIETTRKCSAKAWLTRNEKVCTTETTVVKASCQ